MKGGTQSTTCKGKNSRINLKWSQKGNRPKLLALITSNNNKQQYDGNQTMIIGATSAQFPK
jgi:hypothetical protein